MRIYNYNSMGEYFSHLSTFIGIDEVEPVFESSSLDSKTMKDALDALNNGRELSYDIEELTNIEFSDKAIDSVVHRDVYGFNVNIGEYLSGAPDCFVSYKDDVVDSRIIRINLDLACPQIVDPKDINTSALNLLKAINTLEVSNYQVEVFSSVYVVDKQAKNKNKSKILFSILTKRAGEVLNPNIFFSLISVDFLRHFYAYFVRYIIKDVSNSFKMDLGVPMSNDDSIPVLDFKKRNTEQSIELILKKSKELNEKLLTENY